MTLTSAMGKFCHDRGKHTAIRPNPRLFVSFLEFLFDCAFA
jgi:hypothetical protein